MVSVSPNVWTKPKESFYPFFPCQRERLYVALSLLKLKLKITYSKLKQTNIDNIYDIRCTPSERLSSNPREVTQIELRKIVVTVMATVSRWW